MVMVSFMVFSLFCVMDGPGFPGSFCFSVVFALRRDGAPLERPDLVAGLLEVGPEFADLVCEQDV